MSATVATGIGAELSRWRSAGARCGFRAAAYGHTPEAPMRVIPSAAVISRMEECFDWLLMLEPDDARIVWMRTENRHWKQICARIRVVRSTAWRRWVAALMTISKKLKSQAKSERKAKAANPPAAPTGRTPREGGAKPQPDGQDALNFGHDT